MCRLGGVVSRAHLLASPVHHQQGCNFANASLHRLQADQVAVEFVEHLLHADPLVGSPQVHNDLSWLRGEFSHR
jgi:hypothetical protein